MNDAVKGYLALASGLTEVTKQRAVSAAKALVAQGGAAAGQVTALADDLVAQSKSNREAVAALVRFEVDKALGRVGLASAEEVTELQRPGPAASRPSCAGSAGSGAAAKTGRGRRCKTGAANRRPGAEEAPAQEGCCEDAAKKAPPRRPQRRRAPVPDEDPADPVDRAVALLDHLDERPVAEHVEVFDAVHRSLQDALATLDEV